MNKPTWGADLLLTVWVIMVAVIFFGPLLDPLLGLWTTTASLAYLLLVVAAAATLTLRFLRRSPPKE